MGKCKSPKWKRQSVRLTIKKMHKIGMTISEIASAMNMTKIRIAEIVGGKLWEQGVV